MKLSELKPGDLVALYTREGGTSVQRRVVHSINGKFIELGARQAPTARSKQRFTIIGGRQYGQGHMMIAQSHIEVWDEESHAPQVKAAQHEHWRRLALHRLAHLDPAKLTEPKLRALYDRAVELGLVTALDPEAL